MKKNMGGKFCASTLMNDPSQGETWLSNTKTRPAYHASGINDGVGGWDLGGTSKKCMYKRLFLSA